MINKIDEETLDFICRKNLTIGQFAICLMIYHKDVTGIIKYFNEIGYLGDSLITKKTGEKVTEIDDLLERGFLLNHGLDRSNEYALDNFVVTEQFTKGFLIGTEEVAQELWEAYPKFILINNEEKPTKVCDFEDVEEKYLKTIQCNIKKHQSIMRKLETYKKTNKYAPCNLMNFIASRYWEDYMKDESAPKSRIY